VRLGQKPLEHTLLKPLAVARAAVEFHRVIGVDRHPECREESGRQTGALVDGAQAQRTGVMDHQPCAVMRNSGQFGDSALEEGDMSLDERAEQQAGRQPLGLVQMSGESLRVLGPTGLVDKVDGGAFTGADGDLQRQLRRHRMMRQQMFPHLLADKMDSGSVSR
jgi:hypothetical protein